MARTVPAPPNPRPKQAQTSLPVPPATPTNVICISRRIIDTSTGLPVYTPVFYTTFPENGTQWSFTMNSVTSSKNPDGESGTNTVGGTPGVYGTQTRTPAPAGPHVSAVSQTACLRQYSGEGIQEHGVSRTSVVDRSISRGNSVYSTRDQTRWRSVSDSRTGGIKRTVERQHGSSTWRAPKKRYVSNFNPDLLPRNDISGHTCTDSNYVQFPHVQRTVPGAVPLSSARQSTHSCPKMMPMDSPRWTTTTSSTNSSCHAPVKKKKNKKKTSQPIVQTQSTGQSTCELEGANATNICGSPKEQRKLRFPGEL